MKRYLLFFLLFLPQVSADTADIPALTGTGTERFIAAWWTSDGATIPAATTQYTPIFGDGAPRTTETDILAQATFYYNVTNFRVVSNTAACGALGAGETFTFVLRKNQAATTLTGSCTSGSAANSFTLDTDIVAIAPGDRLSISVMSDASILGRALRAGVSLEGFKTITVTTTPVVDMTNEMLDTVILVMPLIAFIGAVIWAEMTKEFYVYLLAIVAGGIAMVNLFAQFMPIAVIVVGATVLLALRAYDTFQGIKEKEDMI